MFRLKIRYKRFYTWRQTKIPLTFEREVLVITIGTNLNFYSRLKQLCKKVANKLNVLTGIIPYLDKKQINLLYNSFFKGQWVFGLCGPRPPAAIKF